MPDDLVLDVFPVHIVRPVEDNLHWAVLVPIPIVVWHNDCRICPDLLQIFGQGTHHIGHSADLCERVAFKGNMKYLHAVEVAAKYDYSR